MTGSGDVPMAESPPSNAGDVPLCIQEILGDEPDKWLSAVRSLKNRIIGSSKRKQQAFDMGVLPRILQFVSDPALTPTVDDDLAQVDTKLMLQCEAAIVLGSLAKGSPLHVRMLVDAGAVQALTLGLDSNELRVLEACLKCLRSIFAHDTTCVDLLYQTPTLIDRLIHAQALSLTNQMCVTEILYQACQTPEHQRILTEAGTLNVALAQLLGEFSEVRCNALRLLAGLTYENKANCHELVQSKSALVMCLQRDRPVEIQFAAAKCLTNMYRCGLIAADDDVIVYKVMPTLVRMCKPQIGSSQSINQHVIRSIDHTPTHAADSSPPSGQSLTSRLCTSKGAQASGTSMRCEALHALAYLCEHDVNLQRAAAESNQCLRTLAMCLHAATASNSVTGGMHMASTLISDDQRQYANLMPLAAGALSNQSSIDSGMGNVAATVAALAEAAVTGTSIGPIGPTGLEFCLDGENPGRLEIAALNALASLSLNDESIRRKVGAEVPLFEHVLRSAMEPSANREHVLAVCKCLHSLSRSVEQLRITFTDKSNVWKTLMMNSTASALDLQLARCSSAVLANLLLQFSCCQQQLIDAGAVEICCELAKHDDPSVRLNAVWALMNISYRAPEKLKTSIMQGLGSDQLLGLLTDAPTDSPIVTRLLNLLRNILAELSVTDAQGVTTLSNRHVDSVMASSGTDVIHVVIFVLENDYPLEAKELALQILSNIAASNSKQFIMDNEDILRKITTYTMVSHPQLQMAAVACVTNLVWNEDDDFQKRQEKLQDIGVHKMLQQLQNTADSDVYERVKLALQQF